jgi:tetratricopeptide (TPR) repeat protein
MQSYSEFITDNDNNCELENNIKIANNLKKLQKYKDSEYFYKEALNEYNRTNYNNQVLLMMIYSKLSLVNGKQGKYKEAELFSNTALELSFKNNGEDENTASILSDLAGIYCSMGKYDLSEKTYIKSMKIFLLFRLPIRNELALHRSGPVVLHPLPGSQWE